MAGVVYKEAKRLSDEESITLMLRFYHGGRDCYASSRIVVPRVAWSAEEHSLRVNRRVATPRMARLIALSDRMERLRAYVMSSWVANPPERLSAEWLAGLIAGFYGESVSLTDLPVACKTYIATHEIALSTARNYAQLACLIERYGAVGGQTDAERWGVETIGAFGRFLRTERHRTSGRSENTVISILHRLAAVFNMLVETKKLECSPFDDYKFGSMVFGTPVFLTLEERDRLARFDFRKESDRRYRDMFVFQCHVGCRHSDMYAFTKDNVSGDILSYIPVKTIHRVSRTVTVPLSDEARRIIERYKGLAVRLLPVTKLVAYNRGIAKVMRLAGLDRLVTVRDAHTGKQRILPLWQMASSHMARRTFAANAYRAVRDTRLVASMTGHVPSSKAFDRYVVVDEDAKRFVIASINCPESCVELEE